MVPHQGSTLKSCQVSLKGSGPQGSTQKFYIKVSSEGLWVPHKESKVPDSFHIKSGCAVAEENLALPRGDHWTPPTPLPTLGKRFLEPRRPVGRALRVPPLRCPSRAGARFPRKCLGWRWIWDLAGHWESVFKANSPRQAQFKNQHGSR